MTKPVIGFIGLGLMGGNMVENLQKRDFKPIVMDLNKEIVASVVARGGSEATSAAELAAASDIIMLCLTTSNVVEKVMYGEDGILAGIKEGAVVIDFGTSIPASTRKIGADLAAKGAGMVDAALGRTPAHALDGLLNIMAAGDQETFDKVKPILEMQGENIFYMGALGAGHTTKLINNFMGMTTVCAMSQAFAVAESAGVDRQQLFDIMSTGPSTSRVTRRRRLAGSSTVSAACSRTRGIRSRMSCGSRRPWPRSSPRRSEAPHRAARHRHPAISGKCARAV